MTKSAAQIRRMQKRASKRGDTYSYVAPSKPIVNIEEDVRKFKIIKLLQDELDKLEKNEAGLNSKERRSSKRKAEAIALEEVNAIINASGGDGGDNDDGKSKNIANIEDLLGWHKANQSRVVSHMKKKNKQNTSSSQEDESSSISKEDQSRIDAYQKYKTTLSEIENNSDLNSKDRRSAKRKTEAIACEESKFESIQELSDWYDSNPHLRQKKRKNGDMIDETGTSSSSKKPNNPYILFIGQIPYTTTEDDIHQHFQKYIGKKEITKESMRIRIPQDKEKNKKILEEHTKKKKRKQEEAMVMDMNNDVELGVEELSDYEEDQYDDGKAKTQCKGFAFAEFNDPELMYECLKLHHTDLNGRRINVIRSAGGGKEARKEKFKERAKEQDEYISATVDKIFKDYIDRGDLQEGELDNGAVLICKRRSAAIVEAALSEYIEQKADKDLENPSSFFMRIVCNVTEDGEAGTQSYIQKKKKQNEASDKTRSKKPRFERGGDSKPISKGGSFLGGSSLLAKAGVDMSLSEKGGQKSMSSIFPSMSRGRGRGRGGYM